MVSYHVSCVERHECIRNSRLGTRASRQCSKRRGPSLYPTLSSCHGNVNQVVTPEIIETIVELTHSHDMWNYLKAEFYRDTPFALISSVFSHSSLSTAYDPSLPKSSFVFTFEREWLRLYKLAKASSDSYRQKIADFLSKD